MKKLLPLILFAVCFYSCNQNHEVKIKSKFVELPHDLSNIKDSVFIQLDEWLKDAEFIGLSEGEHGMNEGMDFRNSYIKYLVRTKQIQVFAFESGLIESRMVNDYILGKNLNIDSVLTKGFSYNFGDFKQNRDLLKWLRKTNESRNKKERIHFYGFDIAGSASNPNLENSSYSLYECLDYLKEVDNKLFQELSSESKRFTPYLKAVDNPKNKGLSFVDLSNIKKESYIKFLENLISNIEKNKSKYIQKSGIEKYQWGLQMATCAKQNLTFLIGYHQPKKDQSSRESFMLENIKWIRKKERNKKIVLFAHLSHLAKDISRITESGDNTIPETMFGEHMAAEFGAKYKVVGNIFRSLDYYEGIDSVKVNSFPEILYSRYGVSNFCLRIDNTDNLFSKPQMYGIPFKGDLWMTPSKSIDVVFYTVQQHWFIKD
jgi:erythromycin esterase